MEIEYKEFTAEDYWEKKYNYSDKKGLRDSEGKILQGYVRIKTHICELYFYNGLRHNSSGPAVDVIKPQWWYHGKFYLTQSEWFEALTKEEKRNYIWQEK